MCLARRMSVLCVGLLLTGCGTHTGVDDLHAVYGLEHLSFKRQALRIDLNDDGHVERLVLFVDERRGLGLPNDRDDLESGVVVDGFAVFDGRRPNVPVIYQYRAHDGYQIRLDTVNEQRGLISDGGRDHHQYYWGWWDHDNWQFDGWEARSRKWNNERQAWGQWRANRLCSVIAGK